MKQPKPNGGRGSGSIDSRPTHAEPKARPGSSVLKLLKLVRSGSLSGKNLAMEDRLRCVEHLTGEGVSVPEIAELLGVSERTIARDRVQIRRNNALQPNSLLVSEIAGVVLHDAERAIGRMRRLARDPNVPPAVRLEAERLAVQTRLLSIETLRSLAMLPEIGSYGAAGLDSLEPVGFKEMNVLIRQIAKVGRRHAKARPDLMREIESCTSVVEKLAVAETIEQLQRRVESEEQAA